MFKCSRKQKSKLAGDCKMRAYAIYTELSKERFWTTRSGRARWLAARYYSGADTLDDLQRQGRDIPISRNFSLAPMLSAEEVAEIIRLR